MEVEKQKSWFKRNWPWVVPVGGCLTLIIIAAIGIGTVFLKMPEILDNVEPIQYGITRAIASEDLKEAIGEPIDVDRYGNTEGTFDIKNENSEVDLVFPLKGPKGKASLLIKGKKINGEWMYEELSATLEDSDKKINLLDRD